MEDNLWKDVVHLLITEVIFSQRIELDDSWEEVSSMQAFKGTTTGTFFVCFGDMPHLEHKILKVQLKYNKEKHYTDSQNKFVYYKIYPDSAIWSTSHLINTGM